LASTEETKPTTTKANIHARHKNTTAQNKQKKTEARFGYRLHLGSENNAGPILQLPGAKWGKEQSNITTKQAYCIHSTPDLKEYLMEKTQRPSKHITTKPR